jgi:Holliday junction resolvase RusA-like endonuclease
LNSFKINQKLCSLNDWWYALASNKYVGAKFKKDIEEAISWYIRQALASKTLHKPTGAVVIRFEWHEKTKRRDADNIASAKKFILDALVKTGVLVDDSRRYVKGFYDSIIDDTSDYVIVELIEVNKGV